MLVYVFSSILLISPLLQAVFDLQLQLAFQQAALLAFLAWLFLKYRAGALPDIFGGKFRLLWCAAAFSFLSLLLSPFKGYIFNEWGNYAAGLLIYIYSSFLGADERRKMDGAVMTGAWLVMVLSLAQAFVLQDFTRHPPFTNLNALALYAVMVFPLALERRSWALAAAMSILVIWTQSLGALLAGLTGAGYYAFSRVKNGERSENKWILALLLVLVVPMFYMLQADSMAGRLAWWKSAWEMFAARPLAGFGYAAYTWAQAGFQQPGVFREHAIYAHNYYLEFLAENGIFAAAAWFCFLAGALRSRKGLVKYSVLAALVHSAMDFGLSVPAAFWLFCYLLAEPAEGKAAVVRPARAYASLAVVVVLLEAAVLALDVKSAAFERARKDALADAANGVPASAEARLAPYLETRLFRAPALEFLGRLYLAREVNPDKGLSSAVYYEMALLENPYSPQAWLALEHIYAAPGLERAAAGLAARKAEVYK